MFHYCWQCQAHSFFSSSTHPTNTDGTLFFFISMAAEVTANTTENKNSSTPTGIAASTKSPGQWEKSELQTTLQIEVTLKV